jgi:tetratricopeptide (TPR) repeat protein
MWIGVFLLVGVSLIATSTLLAQVKTKVSKEDLAVQELVDLLAEYPDDARVHYRLGILLSRQDHREEALEHIEEAIRLDPECERYSNAYRMVCTWWAEYLRCIDFFEETVEKNPNAMELKLHLSLAYVDKMPWSKMGMVSQGKLSNKSMAQLTTVIEADSSNWSAWYARAMNHLHWPRAMKHAKRSIADFEKAIELQEAMELSEPGRYFEYTYIGLGDALVKDYRHDEGREAWRRGLKLFPHSAQLRKRLSFDDNVELEEWMKKARALKKQIDTDLSIVWAK